MASQDKDIDSEDSGDSVRSSQEVPEPVHAIFEEIFDSNIQRFRGPLEFINENKFGDVWSTERERNDKTMRHAKTFVSAVVAAFRDKHVSVSKEINGRSACDEFQTHVLKRFSSIVGKDGMLKHAFDKTKLLFIREISKIKENLEKKEEEAETAPKTDVDEVISNTDLEDPVHVNHALLCCRVAHECEDLENPEKCLDKFPEKHWLSELVVSYQSKAVPRYVMARSGNVLYVAFRGLESSPAYNTIAGNVKVNTSWKGQINSLFLEEAEKVPCSYFAREIVRNNRIIFTGHSTGGAIASLVVISLLNNIGSLASKYTGAIKCITFGMTPVGDERFRKLVESIPCMKECFRHIVKHDDVIPKLFGSNVLDIQNNLLDHVVKLVNVPLQMIEMQAVLSAPVQVALWNVIKESVEWTGLIRSGLQTFTPSFDIFGEYHVLNPEKEQKCTVLTGQDANEQLSLQLTLRQIPEHYKDYLINHRIERYDIDVRQCLVNEYPEGLSHLPRSVTKKPKDIFPEVEDVQFESFGSDVIAKVNGKNMWFVHEVIIRGLEPLSGKPEKGSSEKTKNKENPFSVKISKNSESSIEINMGSVHLVSSSTANVKAKMHFQDSKYMEAKYVESRTTLFDVSKRQEQLAKLSPSLVIELAQLSALLERRISCGKEDGEDPHSEKYANIKEFFEGVISVVPVESLFHAIAVSQPYTVLQCCQLLSQKEDLLLKNKSSKFLRDGMKLAIQQVDRVVYCMSMLMLELPEGPLRGAIPIGISEATSFKKVIDYFCNVKKQELDPFKSTIMLMERYLKEKQRFEGTICGLNLNEVYASSQEVAGSSAIEHPLTLVKNGRDELNALSKNMSSAYSAENANSMMLEKLNDVRENFRTSSALLGSFMEAHVHVPLQFQEHDEVARTDYGFKVWMLLAVPILKMKTFISRILEGSRNLLVEVSSFMRNLYDDYETTDTSRRILKTENLYAGKLQFLMTSMKNSSLSSNSYVAYSLERQLVIECEKRHINYETPLETILQQWDENFPEEALTMVDEDYRPMIARWIKWSLMIHKLRESLAEQTAVGVIGLVNSGKSRFVRSMFGIETVSGTAAEKRTTVPYIYNLDEKIQGLDVIDFPGVDDVDKSIPELAKLLLSLTRIVVFVVEYKRAHTDAVAQWLEILEAENVPVLVCLSFADKLYSEYMSADGQYPENSEVKKLLKEQLQEITTGIGQPKKGKRDIKFVVFNLDKDSCLKSNEGKQKLQQAGLHDEIEIGRWIAQMLRENIDEELGNRVLDFTNEMKSNTLYFDQQKPFPPKKRNKSEGEPDQKEDVSQRSSGKKRRRSFTSQSSEQQAMCSKDLPAEKLK